uniref:Uncharacterized protein n=1 Tax=viral metagenome TaxID=1070528 RepID=A0A6C0I5H4_9ZZZZ
MACFLNINEEETLQKINIDELYAKKKLRDTKQLGIFNKILNRVQLRIKHTAKTKADDKHIWFTVPEYIFGEPIYDKGDCIGYLVAKLEDNGFFVRYLHPNTLFVTWQNWVPTYVRNEIKKNTGFILNEKGVIVGKTEEKGLDTTKIMNEKEQQPAKKAYTPIGQYKPTGNLVYNPEIFEKIEKKVTFS